MSHHIWRHHAVPVSSRSSPRISRSRRRGRSADRGIPRFLLQTHTEIRRRFLELEYLQNDRLAESLMDQQEDSKWRLDESPEVTSRNRYSNIAAWEYNRIKLKVPSEHCDYINASPIALKSRKDGSVKRYICTQGPKEGQFNHIWRMIWQETDDIAVVVMLTKTYELGRDKCFQYFPEKVGDEAWAINSDDEFGDGFNATINCVEKTKDKRSSCTVRKLVLKVGEKEKTVWHLLFKGWPDFNVPEGKDRSALLEAIKLANEKNSGPHNPLIVQCSAGVGRSGVFVTLDHFIREIDASTIGVDEQEDLVFETVNQLREQRMYMVQSQVQFEFLYQVLKKKFQRRRRFALIPGMPMGDFGEQSSDNGRRSQKIHEHPDTLDMTHSMAHSLRDLGRYEESIELYMRVLARREKALGQEHPLSLDTSYHMAKALSHLGRYQQVLDLYERVLASRERSLGQEHPLYLDTAHNMAHTLRDLGRYEESAELYVRVLASREKALGQEHPLYLYTAHNVAQALSHLERYQQALDLYEHVLANREEYPGQEHPLYLDTAHNMAHTLRDFGRYEESVELYERVLASREKALGQEHSLYLDTAHNMAQALGHLGRYQQALDLYMRVLASREKALGQEHPLYLDTAHNMAQALSHLERYQQALGLYERVLANREKALGQEHPLYLDTAHNMAQALSHLGRYQQALDLYERVLASRGKFLGQAHPLYLDTAHHMSQALSHLERYQQALDLYVSVLANREKTLGQEHPLYLDTAHNMAQALSHLGRYQQALDLYVRVLASRERSLGQAHPLYLDTAHNMAQALSHLERYQQALDLYVSVLANREKALGQEHPLYLDTAHNMAQALSHLGRYQQALDLYERVLASRVRTLGQEHPLYLDTAHHMSQALSHLGRYQQALDLYVRALASRERSLGQAHPLYLDTAHNMAQALSHLGRYQQALDLYVPVVASRKKVLGEDHVNTLATLHSMAWALYHLRRYEEAVVLYTKVLASRQTALGEKHPDTKDTAKKMAQALSCLGQYEEALELYEKFLPNPDIILEEEDPDISATAHNIAKILAHFGRYTEAADFYEKVLSNRRIIIGHKHPDTLETCQDMAFTLGCLGRYAESLGLYGEVLTNQENKLGKDHPDRLRTVQCMASIQEKAGWHSEAQLLYAEVLVGRKKALGEKDPDTLDTARKLAAVVSYLDWDDEMTLETRNEAVAVLEGSIRPGEVPEFHLSTTTQNKMATAARSDLRGEETFRSFQQNLAFHGELSGKVCLETLKPNPGELGRQSQTPEFDEWASYNLDKPQGNEDRSNLGIIPSLRRYARRFEDTTWGIKYKISSLEFSVIRKLELQKMNRKFFPSVDWKCTCEESSHNRLATQRMQGLNQRPNVGGAELGFGLPDFFSFPTRKFLGSHCPPNFLSFLTEKFSTGLSLLESFVQAVFWGNFAPLIGSLTRIANLGSPVSHHPYPTQMPSNLNFPSPAHIAPVGGKFTMPSTGGVNRQYLPPPVQSSHVVRSRSCPAQAPPTPNIDYDYLLLCINDEFVRFRNLGLTPCTTDQQAFMAIREEYYRRRGWWRSHLSFERLKRIEFVQFEVYHQDLVAICAHNDLPPVNNAEYKYSPKPAEPPPVAIDCFMFYFLYPEEASKGPKPDVHLAKMPKRISALSQGEGWGIHFIEERSRARFLELAAVIVIIASIFGVVWTRVKEDIQGGFGVAAFVTSVGAIFIAAGWQ